MTVTLKITASKKGNGGSVISKMNLYVNKMNLYVNKRKYLATLQLMDDLRVVSSYFTIIYSFIYLLSLFTVGS